MIVNGAPDFIWLMKRIRQTLTLEELARQLDLPKPLFLADLKLDPLLRGQVTAFKAISRYPRVVRDLAIVVDDMVKWQQIVDAVATLSDDRIQSVELFDVYRGPGIPDGRQSLARLHGRPPAPGPRLRLTGEPRG